MIRQPKKVPGVKHVFKVQMPVFSFIREGVAVVADSLWAAMQGRKALKVEWDDSGFEHLDTEQLYTRMKEDLKKPGLSQRTGGNPEAVFQKAALEKNMAEWKGERNQTDDIMVIGIRL